MSSNECGVETNAAKIVTASNLYDSVLYVIAKKSSSKRRKRSTEETLDVSNFGYETSPDDSIYNFTWPTKSGKTKIQAERNCKKVIWDENPIKDYCHNVPKPKVDQIVEKCVQDIQITDNYDMAEDKLPEILTLCQIQTASFPTSSSPAPSPNLQLNITDILDESVPEISLPILQKLANIENSFCSGKYYISSDCSMLATTVPEIKGLKSSDLCDVRDTGKGKNSILLFAINTSSAAGEIQCHYEVEKLNLATNLFDGKTSSKQNGTYDNKNTTICPQPDAFEKSFITNYKFSSGVTFSSLSEGRPALKVTIKLSNKNGEISNESATYFLFDSVCYDCTVDRCTEKKNACIINGYCFKNQSSNPDKSSEICNPLLSNSSWTLGIIANYHTFFNAVTIYKINISNVEREQSNVYEIANGAPCHSGSKKYLLFVVGGNQLKIN
ncbi:hypothetical protein HELRODRAFT_165799 [Helobdella robusta]|uniref:Vwde helical domain-containing protein n=1 Tax=Helobdella robusta TaxID=6412 RepID=T1EXA8_HELRO|nr:hypothetical protein HELRODRAFT_165799 [Helobdella robusta]ESN91732.1 hypothetical protein HELRODRAFT_165799 [Helobdella robusta]